MRIWSLQHDMRQGTYAVMIWEVRNRPAPLTAYHRAEGQDLDSMSKDGSNIIL